MIQITHLHFPNPTDPKQVSIRYSAWVFLHMLAVCVVAAWTKSIKHFLYALLLVSVCSQSNNGFRSTVCNEKSNVVLSYSVRLQKQATAGCRIYKCVVGILLHKSDMFFMALASVVGEARRLLVQARTNGWQWWLEMTTTLYFRILHYTTRKCNLLGPFMSLHTTTVSHLHCAI